MYKNTFIYTSTLMETYKKLSSHLNFEVIIKLRKIIYPSR